MTLSRFLLIALVLPLFASCGLPTTSVTPTYLYLSVDGEFGASETGSSATTDMDDLGLDDEKDTLYPRADFSWSSAHLSLSSVGGSWSGDGQLDGSITIDDTTIPAGTDVDSDFDFRATTAIFTWDLIPLGMAELGLGLGVTLVDIDMEFEESEGTESIESDETFPVPLLAARLGFDAAPVEVNGSIGYLDLSIDDVDATVIDFDVNASLHLFGGDQRLAGDLILGYRWFDIDGEYDDGDSEITADFDVSGPYLGMRFSF